MRTEKSAWSKATPGAVDHYTKVLLKVNHHLTVPSVTTRLNKALQSQVSTIKQRLLAEGLPGYTRTIVKKQINSQRHGDKQNRLKWVTLIGYLNRRVVWKLHAWFKVFIF